MTGFRRDAAIPEKFLCCPKEPRKANWDGSREKECLRTYGPGIPCILW